MYRTRITIFLGAVALVLAILLIRLGQIQLVMGDFFLQRAEEALKSTEVLPAERGRILDRNGRLLAVDRPCFDFCLDYRFLTEDPAWIRRQVRDLAREHDVQTEEARKYYEVLSENTWDMAQALARENDLDLGEVIKGIRRRVRGYRRIVGGPVREERQAHPIVAGLEYSTAVAVGHRWDEMIGAELRPGHKRWYPHAMRLPDGGIASPACHIIGVMGLINPIEQDKYNLAEGEADELTRRRHNYRGWDRIGKTGIEAMAEKVLRGRRGYRRLKRGREEALEDVPAQPGGDVRLTLDIQLQEALTLLLAQADQTGSIVVLDIPTREVLALVSYPIYDLNGYQRSFSELAQDEVYLPLLNRAVGRTYAPGSTVKPIVGLAALAEHAIDESTTFHCRGYLRRPGRFRCTGRHGEIALVEAIKRSCNIYFYEVGELLGVDRILLRFRMMGLYGKPGTGLPEEKAAQLPTLEAVQRMQGRGYTPADARFLGIGQGIIGFSPLHVCNAIATVAAGGQYATPRLIRDFGPPQDRLDQPIPTEHANLIRRGMWKVVNESGGTAYRHFKNRFRQPLGFEVCGKTGTAEAPPHRVDSNDNGRIDGGDRIVRSGNMAWFVGFAPYHNPRIAIAVLVEHTPGHGGSTCGPIAADAMLELKQRGYLP
jgi:penicillin-binding protein 2